MVIAFMRIIETNLIRVSLRCINRYFHFNNYLKQLYLNNKKERVSYKDGCYMRTLATFHSALPYI